MHTKISFFLVLGVLTFSSGCGSAGHMKIYDERSDLDYERVEIKREHFGLGRPFYYHDGRKVYVDESPGSVTPPRAPGKPPW